MCCLFGFIDVSLWWVLVVGACMCFFFFKQKTAYEMRISDWSSDVCSSDLADVRRPYGPQRWTSRRPDRTTPKDGKNKGVSRFRPILASSEFRSEERRVGK